MHIALSSASAAASSVLSQPIATEASALFGINQEGFQAPKRKNRRGGDPAGERRSMIDRCASRSRD